MYIDKKGSEPEFYSAGWKNRENRIPADPQALFKIASISKLYIAAATAKLVSMKVLSLDKTLSDYLPELDNRIEHANQISLRMLLRHRSGIPDFIDEANFPWSNLPESNEAFLKLVLDKPADFTPDHRYRYSNTNYLLIGNILDKALGYSHREFIQKEIVQRLGLTHTYGLLNEADPGQVISGYYVGYEGELTSQNYVCPGGSMVATAQDVGVFLRALKEGSLLNAEEQSVYSSVYPYEHTGLLPGYSSIVRHHEDIDAVVVLFVNTSGGNSWTKVELIHKRIAKILRRSLSKK